LVKRAVLVLKTELTVAVVVSNLIDTMSCMSVPLIVRNVPGRALLGLMLKPDGAELSWSFLHAVKTSRAIKIMKEVFFFMLFF
jgi:hypothetical protein